MDLTLFAYRERYLAWLEAQRRRLAAELAEREKTRREVQVKYLEVSKERKVLEKLKERRAAEYYREARQEEFAAQDESPPAGSGAGNCRGGREVSDYSGVGAGFRIVVLILLVGVLALGGLVWFDYLGVIDARRTLAPVFRLFGARPPELDAEDPLLLDKERLAKQLEALAVRAEEQAALGQKLAAQEQDLTPENRAGPGTRKGRGRSRKTVQRARQSIRQ